MLERVKAMIGKEWFKGDVVSFKGNDLYGIRIDGRKEEVEVDCRNLRTYALEEALSRSRPAKTATPTVSRAIIRRPLWPRMDEKKKLPCDRDWEGREHEYAKSRACVNRAISEEWDDFDTLHYNAWLGVSIEPTLFVHGRSMRQLGIDGELVQLMENLGLGNMALTEYDLYPDLVRQFMATVRVYYQDEVLQDAQQGVLTFFAQGKRYRLPLPELCDLYGFERTHRRVVLPDATVGLGHFWSYFGRGDYDSADSTQMDIAHPVLRCFVRILSNTLLCKMEPNKMRVSELMLMRRAIREFLPEGVRDWPELTKVNLGAVFAHHLVSLKLKPFRGKNVKKELIGSLLTPIFGILGFTLGVAK